MGRDPVLSTKTDRGLRTISLLGSSRLLTEDGSLATVEHLAGDYGEIARIAFKAPHGRVKFKTVRNFRPSELITSSVIKIYLANGHVLSATEHDLYATADGELVEASTLKVDDYLSVLCYNAKTKFLSTEAVRIETLYVSQLSRGPQFLYDMDFSSESCLPLVSSETEAGEVSCVTYSNIIQSGN